MEMWVVQLVSTFTLAGVALFIAFLGNRFIEKWKRKFYAPDLLFEFKFEEPHRHQTTMRRDIIEDGVKTGEKYFPCYYFNFAVVNKGRSAAEDCEAVLEKVWQKDGTGNWHEWKDFLGVSLIWAFGDPPKGTLKTIYPGRKAFCNIGHIEHPGHQAGSSYRRIPQEDKKKDKFFFESPDRPYVQWDCLVVSEYQYRIQISVYGRNAKRITRTFEINWSGGWKDKEEEMFKGIVIS